MKTFIGDVKYILIGVVILSMALMADVYDSITKRSK
jgi:hypothetical protein